MNPSTVLARVLVDELCRCGVRDAVLAPGSRNAPLAYALYDADGADRLRLHVRVDERSAAFLALGLAKIGRRAVPVVTTSGTAAANLHPAVLEADHSGVPLVVLTADRPAELRDTGANQTTDQVKLYGDAVRHFVDVPAAEQREGQNAYWRGLVSRAIGLGHGVRDRRPGPVHLNVAFRDPLVPDLSHGWPESLVGRPDGARWTQVERLSRERFTWLPAGPRTVVVAGDGTDPQARWLAETAGWPLLAEPSSGSRSGPNALGAYSLLLGADEHPLVRSIERVVVYGRPTLTRPVSRLLAREDVEVIIVSRSGDWTDPARRATKVGPAVALEGTADGITRAEPDPWLRAWLDAADAARTALDSVLQRSSELTGLEVARTVADLLPPGGLLVTASSNPIRDLDLAAAPWDNRLVDENGKVNPGDHRRVVANRGLSGIDGTLSTAIGAALAHPAGPAYALVGDLALLHDSNALVRSGSEPWPDLTIVVVNDDGGGIFTTLEQGDPAYAEQFERLFGTPHGVDIAALAHAYGLEYVRVDSAQQLRAALAEVHGVRLVEVRINRTHIRDLHTHLRLAVADAIKGVGDDFA